MKPRISLFIFVLIAACGNEPGSGTYSDYKRADLRMYAYAPPLIPHEVLNRDCLDCHETGLVVEGRKAPITPHPQLVNCEQCHVRADERIQPFRDNSFVGVQEKRTAQLPQPAGPPLIPHRVFMRENCLVCHGDHSRAEITQTTHPERSNCVQCHIEQQTGVEPFQENGNLAATNVQ